MAVRPATPNDRAWIAEILARYWGGPLIVAAEQRVIDATQIPALIAGERYGLATYVIDPAGADAELVTLNAFNPRRGVGTALIEALVANLRAAGVATLRVSTTNDNLDALRFYQRRGFRLTALHPGAIDAARKAKPAIPLIGNYGIALRDRLDLMLVIAPR